MPDTPGNDRTLLRIKEGLSTQGIFSSAEPIPENHQIPALTPSHGTPVPEVPEGDLQEHRQKAIEGQEKTDDTQQLSQSPLSISGTGPDGESGGTGTKASSSKSDFPNKQDKGESSIKTEESDTAKTAPKTTTPTQQQSNQTASQKQ